MLLETLETMWSFSTRFSAGLCVIRERLDLRLFYGVDFRVGQVVTAGFTGAGQRSRQAMDSPMNKRMHFRKG
jgi:hypothetical protein